MRIYIGNKIADWALPQLEDQKEEIEAEIGSKLQWSPIEKLVASIKEAGEIRAGRKSPSRVYEIKPPEIKTVREKLNVSQNEFALMIGVSVRTLQNWEQGRRKPEGPAKALLRIASRNPSAVLDALHAE